MIPFTPLRTQNKQALKLLVATPVVLPGFATLHVVSAAAQPARPMSRSGNEFTTRLPRPKPPNTSGYRTFSNSNPTRRVCAPLVQESVSAYCIWFDGANDGFKPPPTANAPVMLKTGGCV